MKEEIELIERHLDSSESLPTKSHKIFRILQRICAAQVIRDFVEVLTFSSLEIKSNFSKWGLLWRYVVGSDEYSYEFFIASELTRQGFSKEVIQILLNLTGPSFEGRFTVRKAIELFDRVLESEVTEDVSSIEGEYWNEMKSNQLAFLDRDEDVLKGQIEEVFNTMRILSLNFFFDEVTIKILNFLKNLNFEIDLSGFCKYMVSVEKSPYKKSGLLSALEECQPFSYDGFEVRQYCEEALKRYEENSKLEEK